MVTNGLWYVWVTASSDAFAEALCAKLIRRGWTVGPLDVPTDPYR